MLFHWKGAPFHIFNAGKRDREIGWPASNTSFHGNRFGEIARLVDRTSAQTGGVVGKQLQRQRRQERLYHPVSRRKQDPCIAKIVRYRKILTGNQDDVCAPGAHLADVAGGLVKQSALRGDRDDRCARFDQGDGAVFELSGRIGLAVDLGDLLEL